MSEKDEKGGFVVKYVCYECMKTYKVVGDDESSGYNVDMTGVCPECYKRKFGVYPEGYKPKNALRKFMDKIIGRSD